MDARSAVLERVRAALAAGGREAPAPSGVAPAATPQAIVDRLSEAATASVTTDPLRSRLIALGFVPIGSKPEGLRARVDAEPIFVRDENVYTSAGVTAGMDLALALVEEDHGSRLALQVARNLVLYLRRPGGQSQFSAALSLQLTDRKPLLELEAWVLDNLQEPLTVPLLAERVAMSPRNFARVFTKEMKTTPAKFVERLRVEAARRRLEESHNSMEMIADECGFGNVNSMRNVFQRTLKIAPGQYRRHFRHVKHSAQKKST